MGAMARRGEREQQAARGPEPSSDGGQRLSLASSSSRASLCGLRIA